MTGAPPRRELLPRVALEIEARVEMGKWGQAIMPNACWQQPISSGYALCPIGPTTPPVSLARMNCLNTWDISHSNHSESLEGECPFPKKEEG